MPEPIQATSLITDELTLFVFLTSLVGFIFLISEFRPLKRLFHYFPPLVFCYFLPMLTTTAGITPTQSPLYGWFGKVFLPPILILLLLSADLKSILRLGPKALFVMLAGSVGIVTGAIGGYAMLKGKVDPEGWKNIGALAASWTGGSANMFAVKAALDIPDKVFSPMIMVDTVLAYSWMGIVIAFSGAQHAFAKRFRVDMSMLDELDERVRVFAEREQRPMSTRSFLLIVTLALGGGLLCTKGGAFLNDLLKPTIESFNKSTDHGTRNKLLGSALATFSSATIAVILATVLGLVLSATPASRLESSGASSIGYGLLFLLLPTFGAQANLREFGLIPWYAVIGALMIGVHALFLFLAVLTVRAPLFLGATSSQANVGGPASAAVVATAYQPRLAPVGILLGVFGGIVGTFAGLITANVCHWLAS